MDIGNMDLKQVLNLAKLAESAERYDDMCKFMHKLVKDKSGMKDGENTLAVEERNLLSVAYKNVVGSKRSSWRTLSGGSFTDIDATLVNDYKKDIEKELVEICIQVIDLLKKDQPLINNLGDADTNQETKVFYFKMAGDYYRYLSELGEVKALEDKNLSHESVKKSCEEMYQEAMDVASKSLNETHPTRLGLALNFSVCYYEILKEPQKACSLAKEAFDAAIEKLDTLNDASYKDSTLIMQLLRDNLTLWTSENGQDGAAEDAAGN